MSDPKPVVDSALADFAGARTSAELENAKARYLGRSGIVTEQLKALAALPAAEK
jgi:phenylalanyl-tRNA synthetase alpha chain